MTKTIEITVSPHGETKVETKGFTGGSCREASRLLEEALGKKSVEQFTPEFYQTADTRQREQLRG